MIAGFQRVPSGAFNAGLRSQAGEDNFLYSTLSGYLLKSMLRKQLVMTIRAVHGGSKIIAPEISEEIASFISESPLSGREVEILQHLPKDAPMTLA